MSWPIFSLNCDFAKADTLIVEDSVFLKESLDKQWFVFGRIETDAIFLNGVKYELVGKSEKTESTSPKFTKEKKNSAEQTLPIESDKKGDGKFIPPVELPKMDVEVSFEFAPGDVLDCANSPRFGAFREMLSSMNDDVKETQIFYGKSAEKCAQELKTRLKKSRLVPSKSHELHISSVVGSTDVSSRQSVSPQRKLNDEANVKKLETFSTKFQSRFGKKDKTFGFKFRKPQSKVSTASQVNATQEDQQEPGLWIDSRQVEILESDWFLFVTDSSNAVNVKYVDVVEKSVVTSVEPITIASGPNAISEEGKFDSLVAIGAEKTAISILKQGLGAKKVVPKSWAVDAMLGGMRYLSIPEKYKMRPTLYLRGYRNVPGEIFALDALATVNHSPSSFARNGYSFETRVGYRLQFGEELLWDVIPAIGVRYIGFLVNPDADLSYYSMTSRLLPQSLLVVPLSLRSRVAFENFEFELEVDTSPLYSPGIGVDFAPGFGFQTRWKYKPGLNLVSSIRSSAIRFPLSTKKFSGLRTAEVLAGVNWDLF